jgi:peptidyl-prolyl cis-trans isomerase C
MKRQLLENRYRVILFFVFSFLISGVLGCDKLNFFNRPKEKPQVQPRPTIVKGTIIAKVNNSAIILEEFNQEIDSFNAAMDQAKTPERKITTREQKINYLKNDMVRRNLLYQAALDRGFDRNEDVVRALEKTKIDLLVMELIKQEVEKIEATSKEIEEYYEKYKDQLKEPEERQIREIVVSSEQEARDILIQLLQGVDFATLAKDRSRSASSRNGGDMGFIKRGEKGDKFPQFDTVAFSDTLEAGKVSSFFKGPDGYYILKLEVKRGGRQKSKIDVWDDIKQWLTIIKQQDKIETLITKLSQEAKLEFYEGEIK